MFTSYSHIIFYTLLLSYSIPIELTDTDNYLPPDESNILNLMVSRYNCEKQHNLSQFNLLNANKALKHLQTYNTINSKPEFSFELKRNGLKPLKVQPTQRMNVKSVSKADSTTDVLIELFGTITHYLFLKLLTPIRYKCSKSGIYHQV